MIRSVVYLLVCVWGGTAFAQSSVCHPAARDYLSLPTLTYEGSYTPEFIPEWGPSTKRVDRYGREVAPLANAASVVLSAQRYSEDLGSSLYSATIPFWREFDATGSVSEITRRDYAHFIVKVWQHNSDMSGLNSMIGNADGGLVTGTASVQLPSRWQDISPGASTEELLESAVRADYLTYSNCALSDSSVAGQIESHIVKSVSLNTWSYARTVTEQLRLNEFSDSEKEKILELLRTSTRAGDLYTVLGRMTSPEATRGLFSESFADRERRALSVHWESRVRPKARPAGFFDPSVRAYVEGPEFYMESAGRSNQRRGATADETANNLLSYYIDLRLQGPNSALDKSIYTKSMSGTAAFSCAFERSEEAANYLLDQYPLAFANERDLGLKRVTINPISVSRPMNYAVDDFALMPNIRSRGAYKPQKLIQHLAFELALVGCSSGISFDAPDPLMKSVQISFERRSEMVRQYLASENLQFLPEAGESGVKVQTFEQRALDKASARHSTCLERSNPSRHYRCDCERDKMNEWIEMGEQKLASSYNFEPGDESMYDSVITYLGMQAQSACLK